MTEPQLNTNIELEAPEPAPASEEERQQWISTYLDACGRYQVTPCSDVVTCFQLGLSTLKLYKFANAAPFKELDLQPIMTAFETHPKALEQLRTLNFANAQLGPSGAMVVANWLTSRHCKVETLNYARQLPGASGLNALLRAVRLNRFLKNVHLSGCWMTDAGGEQVLALLQEGQEVHGLTILDLENNGLSFEMCERIKEVPDQTLAINILGNKVMDEVFNAISHGIGIILTIVGTVFMALQIGIDGRDSNYVLAVVIYAISLLVLYTSSTLFHAFLSMGPKVRHVFEIMDHAAIYCLIAGSYAPFILIHLKVYWIMAGLMIGAALGIATTAFYYGPGKIVFEVALYLGMGWSASIYMTDLRAALTEEGFWLLVLGGLCYTGGVPFFAREKKTFGIPDHTIWHTFVLCGSVAHFFCIYNYCLVLPRPLAVSQVAFA